MPLKGALQLSKAYYMAKDMAARTRLIKLYYTNTLSAKQNITCTTRLLFRSGFASVPVKVLLDFLISELSYILPRFQTNKASQKNNQEGNLKCVGKIVGLLTFGAAILMPNLGGDCCIIYRISKSMYTPWPSRIKVFGE